MVVPALGVFVFVAMAALMDNSMTLADAQVTGPQTQSLDNTSNNQGALNQELQSPLVQEEVSPTVKITYPQKGQEVPVGELTVNGISSDTMDTDCEVFVILNGIKPYQPISPTGDSDSSGDDSSSGAELKDHATWTYTFTPKYALIREGENKITSKIACQNGQGDTSLSSNLKHYSVNVTGFDNASTTSSSLLPQNTSETLNTAAVNSSDILNNATVFVVPVPSDLLPQLNGLDGNGQSNLNDNSEGDENNGPDNDNDDSNDNNGGSPDNSGKGKGKAKGHEKDKS